MPNHRLDPTAESVPTVITLMAGRSAPASRTAAPSVTPDAIGGYPVICSLGVGGMAQVYLCHSRGIGGFHKLLVVKTPRPDVLGDADTVEMFLNEARIAGRLNHPNVVQTNEVGLANGIPFMAMEFLEGQSLSAIQRKIGYGKLSTDFQLRVISSALAGLHYAHELEDYHGLPLAIVHRDISPQNVFVTYDGLTKLLDFGIAKTAGSSAMTREGVVKGKISYIAPEQGALEAVDRRADIFSVGIMIWEAATRRRLVPNGSDDLAVLRRRVAGEEPKAHDVAPDVPLELSEICSRAMARRPEDRYQTARELRDAIERYLMSASRPTEHDVGQFMCDTFANERFEVRQQVDEQLSRRAKPSGTFGSTPPHPSESSTAATIVEVGSAKLVRAAIPRARRTRAIVALSAMLTVTGAALGATFVLGHRGGSGTSAATQAPSPTTSIDATAIDAGPDVSSVRIVVTATPASSELVVDDKKVVRAPSRPVASPKLPPSAAPAAPRIIATSASVARPIDERDPYQ